MVQYAASFCLATSCAANLSLQTFSLFSSYLFLSEQNCCFIFVLSIFSCFTVLISICPLSSSPSSFFFFYLSSLYPTPHHLSRSLYLSFQSVAALRSHFFLSTTNTFRSIELLLEHKPKVLKSHSFRLEILCRNTQRIV